MNHPAVLSLLAASLAVMLGSSSVQALPQSWPTVTLAYGESLPRGWSRQGKVEGLLKEDWCVKRTANTISYAREPELVYVDEVVEGLEQSFQFNRSFLGISPPQLPLEFYFCSMDQPAQEQPKFPRLRGQNRFAGVALGGTKICCVNLGDARHSRAYPPWEMCEVARHEMNHLFAFSLQGADRFNSWGWLFEALAHTAENTVKVPSSQMNFASMKDFMRGYKSVDASWASLIQDRNSQEQEQFRDYNNLLISIIYYFQQAYGQNCIAKLMSNCRGRDLEDAFVATFGKGVKELEAGWKTFYGIH